MLQLTSDWVEHISPALLDCPVLCTTHIQKTVNQWFTQIPNDWCTTKLKHVSLTEMNMKHKQQIQQEYRHATLSTMVTYDIALPSLIHRTANYTHSGHSEIGIADSARLSSCSAIRVLGKWIATHSGLHDHLIMSVNFRHDKNNDRHGNGNEVWSKLWQNDYRQQTITFFTTYVKQSI